MNIIINLSWGCSTNTYSSPTRSNYKCIDLQISLSVILDGLQHMFYENCKSLQLYSEYEKIKMYYAFLIHIYLIYHDFNCRHISTMLSNQDAE